MSRGCLTRIVLKRNNYASPILPSSFFRLPSIIYHPSLKMDDAWVGFAAWCTIKDEDGMGACFIFYLENERSIYIKYLVQVLHGCLQFVFWNMRLISLTDAIPVVNLYLTINGFYRLPFGAKTSRYGPHELGYRRATWTLTKWCEAITTWISFS